MHLSHVDRILEALNRPTSGIFVEAAMIGVTCAILAVYFIMLVRGSSQKARRVVGIFGMVVAVVFTYACGSSYMMAARPAWMSIALPLAYCATAAAAGTGLHLLCKGLQKASDESAGFAGTLAGIGAAFGAVASAAFCVHAGSYLAAAENGAVTSVVILFVCLVAEILCGVGALKKPANATAFGAAAVVLGVAAAIALRVAMWQIGTPSMDFFLVPLA